MVDSTVGQYMAKSSKLTPNPQNAFEHGAFVLDTESKFEQEKKTKRGELIGKFSSLVNKNVLLSNINNDTLMRLYQNDTINLMHIFSMATRDERMLDVFQVLYNGWVGELSLTRTKNGEERKHQARLSSNYKEREQLSGYGNDLPQMQTQEEAEDLMGKVKNMFKRGV